MKRAAADPLPALIAMIRRSLGEPDPAAAVQAQLSKGEFPTLPPTVYLNLLAETRNVCQSAPFLGRLLAQVVDQIGARYGGPLFRAHRAFTLGWSLNLPIDARRAIQHYAAARPLFEEAGLVCWAARCSLEIARNLRLERDLARALKLVEVARQIFIQKDNVYHQAYGWRVTGRLLAEQGKLDRTADCYRRASTLFSSLALPLEVARCVRRQATLERGWGKSLETLGKLKRARQVLADHRDVIEVAWCDVELATLHEELSEFDEAERALQRARDFFEQERIVVGLASCELNLGNLAYWHDRYTAAIDHYQRAVEGFQRAGLPNKVADCQNNLGIVHTYLNNVGLAERLFHAAKRISRSLNLEIDGARFDGNLGLLYMRMQRYTAAFDAYERALYVYEKKNLQRRAILQHNLGELYQRIGDPKQGLDLHRQARQIQASAGNPLQIALCDIGIAACSLDLADWEAALSALSQARANLDQMAIPSLVAYVDRLIAGVYQRSGQASEALPHFERARQTFEQIGLDVEARLCDIGRAEVLALDPATHAKALTCFEQAERHLAAGLPDYAWRCAAGIGQIRLAQGHKTDSLAAFLRAVDYLTTARHFLITESRHAQFFTSRQGVYNQALLLAVGLQRWSDALRIAELARAQLMLSFLAKETAAPPSEDATDPYVASLYQQQIALQAKMQALRSKLIVSDLENASQRPTGSAGDLQALADAARPYDQTITQLRQTLPPGWPDALRVEAPFSLAEFQREANQHLPPRWGALVYHLMGQQLLILYLNRDGVKSWLRDLAGFDRLALQQCCVLDNGGWEMVYRGSLRGHPTAAGGSSDSLLAALYGRLIPIDVANLDHLLIVPHGQLHSLPFHALRGDNGYLIEQVPLSYAPSLQVLRLLWQRKEESSAADPWRALVYGLAIGSEADLGQDGSLLEAQAIWRLFQERGTVYLEESATADSLRTLAESGQLPTFQVLHFAAHAEFDAATPWRSGLKLHDSWLDVWDIMRLQLRARVVTLSGCETARTEVTAGEEQIGLAPAFLYAGAQAVVAGLWPVDNEATRQLMLDFYQELQAGRQPASALQEAQIRLIAQGLSPYFWAPFMAIGA